MKIALVCSQGGHLTEMLLLMEAFEDQDVFFITYKDPTTSQLKYKKYLVKNIGTNLWRMIEVFFQVIMILRKEKPGLIVSTGAEIAIPVFLSAKLLGIKTVYIESWCRVKTKSATGRILYHFSNIFLVQWKELLKVYGEKARFEGAVV